MPDEIQNADTTTTETPAEAVTVETPAVETPADTDAAALAAFDKGVAEVVQPEPAKELTAADVAAAAAAEKTDDPNAAAPPAAAGAPLNVDHAKKDEKPAEAKSDKPVEAAQPDAETEAAVTELGLKDKAAERFRSMASTIKTQAQELEPLRQEAERGRQWEEMVLSTKASPDQFGTVLGYLGAVNSGDPTKMNQAFDVLMTELQNLGKTIGREVPGLVDPIQDHADLAQAVQFGEISRPAALEIARLRATQQRSTERDAQTAQQVQQKTEFDQGMQAVTQLSERLKAEDPAFQAKLQVLAPVLDTIRQTVPPSQWVAKIEDVYKRIQLPAQPVVAAAPAVPARVPVSSMPLRATGAGAPMQKSLKGASEIDAFNMGLESVSR